MKKTLVLFFILLSINLISQDKYFIPKEVKNAIANKTRTISGEVGEKYWQNSADYKIQAYFNPKEYAISGSEIIKYKNNSPDTLKQLYFNIYQNIFKKGVARDWDMRDKDLHDGVNIKSLIINDKKIEIKYPFVHFNSSMMIIALTDVILPKSQCNIELEWELKIAEHTPVRMGTYESKNFMIAYWFPRLAVYDDIRGWNSTPHTGRAEYYNDYGNFEVEITMPDYYNVWSTAPLQNAGEIFTKEYFNRIEKAYKSDEIISIINKNERKDNSKILQKAENVWKFKIENVPDFAFAASNEYLWDASSIDINGKRIKINAVYKPNSIDFPEVANLCREIIDYFSNQKPGIAYPYPQMTAFNGRGGMEFPAMINDGSQENWNSTLHLTAHEIGHTYFPFYVGTNEQAYAWIDEGLISYFPRLIIGEFTNDTNYIVFADIVEVYNKYAGSEIDIPIFIPTTNTQSSYRFQSYTKSAMAFLSLNKMLGDSVFYSALQHYSNKWNSKHPTPYDLFNIFENIANEDLSWFFKKWFFEFGYADLSLEIAKTTEKFTYINIINKGSYPVEIDLNIVYKNGDINNFKESARIWKDGKIIYQLEIPNNKVEKLILNSVSNPDANPQDNILIISTKNQ